MNGTWVGIHRDPDQLVATLKKLRRQMDIVVSEVRTIVLIPDNESILASVVSFIIAHCPVLVRAYSYSTLPLGVNRSRFSRR